ncbi:MAG: hypothetical protein ACE37B_11265 [Ilumatobacter sp.]|uniref:hypothetical protein n=1 Tax=Ilumatobacter sp. TaxID=1967498 RepID=UPI00391BD0F1
MRGLVRRYEGADSLPSIGLGRPSDGGMWGWWFCEACNNRTGAWDERYLNFWRQVLGRVHSETPVVDGLAFRGQCDAGAIGRAIWAWAFALDGNLRDQHPAVAEAVRLGTAVTPPEDVFLRFAVTTSLKMWTTSQEDVIEINLDLRDGTSALSATPRLVVAAPPFYATLVDHASEHHVPWFDLGPLLTYPVGEQHEIFFTLPLIGEIDRGSHRPVMLSDLS